MAAILVIPEIVNNEQVQDIGQETLNLAKEWLQELRPNSAENTK